jgi:hypothetical protein
MNAWVRVQGDSRLRVDVLRRAKLSIASVEVRLPIERSALAVGRCELHCFTNPRPMKRIRHVEAPFAVQ